MPVDTFRSACKLPLSALDTCKKATTNAKIYRSLSFTKCFRIENCQNLWAVLPFFLAFYRGAERRGSLIMVFKRTRFRLKYAVKGLCALLQ